MTWRRDAPWIIPLVIVLLSLSLPEHKDVRALGIVLAVVVAVVQPFVLRPKLGVLLPSMIATVTCAGFAVYMGFGIKRLVRMSASDDHPLPVDVDGPRTLRFRSLPDVSGARVILHGTHGEPTRETIRECGFQVRFRGHKVDVEKTCYSFDSPACLLDTWRVSDTAPEGDPIEVDYVVDDRTRAFLDGSALEVTIPFTLRNDLAMAAGLMPIFVLISAAGALIGVVGLVGAWAKWRDAKDSGPSEE